MNFKVRKNEKEWLRNSFFVTYKHSSPKKLCRKNSIYVGWVAILSVKIVDGGVSGSLQ